MAFSCSCSVKIRPSLYFGIFVAVISTFVPSTHAQPKPVQDMAFARVGPYMYVQGGWISVNGNQTEISSQSFALDLSATWSVNSPQWKQLAQGETARSFNAVGSSDNKTLSTFKVFNGSPNPTSLLLSIYHIFEDRWESKPLTNSDCMQYGSIVTLDSSSGLTYITGLNNLDVYNMTDGSWQTIPVPVENLKQKIYGRGVYNPTRKSLMYLGGYNNEAKGPADATTSITEFNVDTKKWSIMPTTGTIPTPRSDHCMTISEDNSKIIVFGGQAWYQTPTSITGSIYILDIATASWTTGKEQSPRINSACTAAGDQLIVWGGSDGKNTLPGTPLVYDLTKDSWVDTYTAPAYLRDAPKPPTPTPTSGSGGSGGSGGSKGSGDSGGTGGSTGPGGSTGSSSLNLGAIIGGCAGGLVLGVVATGIFIIRKRRKERKERAMDDALAQRRALGAAEMINSRNDNDDNINNSNINNTKVINSQPHQVSHIISPPEYTTRDVLLPSQPPILPNSTNLNRIRNPQKSPNNSPQAIVNHGRDPQLYSATNVDNISSSWQGSSRHPQQQNPSDN